MVTCTLAEKAAPKVKIDVDNQLVKAYIETEPKDFFGGFFEGLPHLTTPGELAVERGTR
jgi:hypothetical protein